MSVVNAADGRAMRPAFGVGQGRDMLDIALLLFGFLLAWQAASMSIGVEVLPGPVETVRKLGELLAADDFRTDAWETGRAFVAGLVISLAAGLVLGLALGFHRLSGEVVEPLLVGIYSIPKVTLYPVILLLFGLGISAKVAFAVMHGIIPVTLFTMNAVRNIPPVHLRTARIMHLSPRTVATRILIPAALPEIVSGFRLGFALTLLGTLIGEMFASQHGIGYQLFRAMEANEVATVMALALLLTIVASSASGAFLAIERRLKSPQSF